MNIKLHRNARTTPAVRAEIAASTERAWVMADYYCLTETMIYKWKKRVSFVGESHTTNRLQTTLSLVHEAIVVELRKTLFLPLADLLAVTREFLCADVSRSGLDKCLRCHRVGNLYDMKLFTPKEPHKAFIAYDQDYQYIDVKYLPQMVDESKRLNLFLAIDRVTCCAFVQIKTDMTACSFLQLLHKACPFNIQKLLTDNGNEFTDRLFVSWERKPSGEHEFDLLCQAVGIEQRLIKPRTPKTNGMVERFNGRIADVLKTNRFNSAEDMAKTFLRYMALYNNQLPLSAL